MRFKMAPNSLFAILLRSPWWISVGLALLLALASRALLPAEYWVFGAMGGFPFLAIGGIALWQQLRTPSGKQVDAIEAAVRAMSWRDFSQQVENAFTRDGFTVERLEGPADFAVTRGNRTTLVAGKRWKAARHGEETVQSLHAAMQARGASGCLYIALGELSDNARRFAAAHNVQVMQGPGLAQLLRTMPRPR